MVAISRLDDYRHDFYDVTCGSILGLTVAYFSYRRYYPPLRAPICDIPYDKSDKTTDGFAKLPNDEEQQIQGLGAEFRSSEGEEVYQLEGSTTAQ